MITIAEAAQQYISNLLADEERQGLALRLEITGRRGNGFQYKLGFVRQDEKAPDDVVVDAGSFQVFIDAESAPNLQGATLAFLDDGERSGFKIENPNAGWTDPKAIAIQQLFDEHINPALADHGGFVVLLDVKDDVAYVSLGGGCQGCGMADVTLKQGIEALITEEVPGIRQVVDSTDHAIGTNPFYEPSKGGGRGQSPFA
jgi:Fe/S biogenesis protein NfuA